MKMLKAMQTPYPAIPYTSGVELTPARSNEEGAKDKLTDSGLKWTKEHAEAEGTFELR